MLCACLPILAAIAGCAPTNLSGSGPSAAIATPGAASAGTIVSMRRVSAQGNSASWRAVLLADAGAASATHDGGNSSLTEFIVRANDGAILSVVQSNEAGFRAGDRVVILHDRQTHLARPG
jgi:outer membrane lipoprotein SlyB